MVRPWERSPLSIIYRSIQPLATAYVCNNEQLQGEVYSDPLTMSIPRLFSHFSPSKFDHHFSPGIHSEELLLNFSQDLLFTRRTFENGEEIRACYILHALNHVLKSVGKLRLLLWC